VYHLVPDAHLSAAQCSIGAAACMLVCTDQKLKLLVCRCVTCINLSIVALQLTMELYVRDDNS
jgi:hypothetical protein